MSATTTVGAQPSSRPGPVQLVVLGADEFCVVRDLPRQGAVSIGRGSENDVDLPDRAVSRLHARLHIRADHTYAIEDLGSANGTQLANGNVPPNAPTRLGVGEAVFMGTTVVFIQPARAARPAVPTHSVQSFETQLFGACTRGSRDGDTFSVVLIEVLDGFARDRIEELAARHVDANGVLATRDACQYAAMIPHRKGTESAGPASKRNLASEIAKLWPAAACAEARFPEDGVTPDALIAAATSRVEAACAAVTDQLIFGDPRMQRLYELARRAAAGWVNVLILGETGTGKDVVARTIHRCSPRADMRLQRIECAALTEGLAESELFGHERGAFTGAIREKAGLIEAAHGGTVFLDEVGELPPRLQAKLLHVLETRQVTRVGAVTGRAVDVRFMAATNRNLAEDAARQRARATKCRSARAAPLPGHRDRSRTPRFRRGARERR